MLSKSQKAALKRFKDSEGKIQLFYLKDKYVKKVCASWEFITREITTIKTAAPKDPNECWGWLWAAVKVNFVELAYVTGTRDKCLAALAIARANRLIYPDGTVNHFVLKELTPVEIEIPETSGTIRSDKKSWKPKPNKNTDGNVGKNKHLTPKDITKPMTI